MTYSIDFRRKVLAVKEKEGLTIAEAAARFFVGKATVVRWLNRIGSSSFGVDLLYIGIKSTPNDRSPIGKKCFLNWGSQEVDDVDEGLVIPVAPGPAFSGLEDAVECLCSGVIVP